MQRLPYARRSDVVSTRRAPFWKPGKNKLPRLSSQAQSIAIEHLILTQVLHLPQALQTIVISATTAPPPKKPSHGILWPDGIWVGQPARKKIFCKTREFNCRKLDLACWCISGPGMADEHRSPW